MLALAAAVIFALLARAPVLANGTATPNPGPASPASARPILQIDNRDLDVGIVQEGTEVIGTFQIKNVGDAELRILSAKPG